jgi:HptB-dependent secretion and biofilm anti anti-sigma factor
MECVTVIQGDTGILRLEGRFTFDSNQDFKSQTRRLLDAPGTKKIHLDLAGVSYLDSNALGMLLLLRESAQIRNVEVKLLSPSPSVMTILEMVQFGKLFTIVGNSNDTPDL